MRYASEAATTEKLAMKTIRRLAENYQHACQLLSICSAFWFF